MLPATQELLTVLKTAAFVTGDAVECARAIQQWQQRQGLDRPALQILLVQFGAQLLHGVRAARMPSSTASERLTRLLVLGDIEIPPSLFALQETLNLLEEMQQAEGKKVVNGDSFVQQQMGRSLANMPASTAHHADICRFTGRYQRRAK